MTKRDGRVERIAIDTDHQLQLEFQPILDGKDKLQRKLRTMFLPRTSTATAPSISIFLNKVHGLCQLLTS